jgi:hypothetical protein
MHKTGAFFVRQNVVNATEISSHFLRTQAIRASSGLPGVGGMDSASGEQTHISGVIQ